MQRRCTNILNQCSDCVFIASPRDSAASRALSVGSPVRTRAATCRVEGRIKPCNFIPISEARAKVFAAQKPATLIRTSNPQSQRRSKTTATLSHMLDLIWRQVVQHIHPVQTESERSAARESRSLHFGDVVNGHGRIRIQRASARDQHHTLVALHNAFIHQLPDLLTP